MDYLIDSFSDRTTFSYDPADRLLVKQLANGARTSHTYDFDGRLTQLYQLRSDNVVLDGLTYDYNNVGVRKKQTDASGAIVTWTYDEIYQLTGERRDGPSIIDWETLTLGEWENLSLADWELMELNPRNGDYQLGYVYDPVGNRLVHSVGGALTTYVYDGANQLSSSQDVSGTTTYAYDGAGNLLGSTAPSGRTTYTWSADNRQTKAELPTSYVVTSTYRADGLRHQKTDAAGTTRFLYDGKAYLAETDGSNVIRAVYANEPAEFGGLVSQRRLSGLLWLPSYYHFDAVGSTRGLTGPSQGLITSYPATAFGEQLTESTQVNPFRFVGQLGYYNDVEAGQNQVRERAYDAKLGRWLSADPARSDANLYRYVGNSPARGVDPAGLEELTSTTTIHLPDEYGNYINSPTPEIVDALRWIERVDQIEDFNAIQATAAPSIYYRLQFHHAYRRYQSALAASAPRRDRLGSWSGWFSDNANYYNNKGGLYAPLVILNGMLVVPSGLADAVPSAIGSSANEARADIQRYVATSDDPIVGFTGNYVAIPLTHAGEFVAQGGNLVGASAPLMVTGAGIPVVGAVMTSRVTVGSLSAIGLYGSVTSGVERYNAGTFTGSDALFITASAAGSWYSLRSPLAATQSTGVGGWQSRPPGIQVRRIGNHWVKRVNPDSHPLMQRWGAISIRAQANALTKLQAGGSPAARFVILRNGAIAVENVGPAMTSRALWSRGYWSALWRDTRILGIPNDLKPHNYGLGFRPFDPAIDPVVLTVAGTGGVGLAGGVLYILHDAGVIRLSP
jgi:RHS repeat-associated protein